MGKRRRHAVRVDRPAVARRTGGAQEELAREPEERVLQLQRSAGNESVSQMLVQRDDGAGGYQLKWPGAKKPSLLGAENQLHLDPEIEAMAAQYRAKIELERILHPPDLATQIRDLPLDLAPASNPAFSTTPTPKKAPLVPAGKGPDTPRAGSAGDVMSAITAVPAVDQALTRLKTQALDEVGSSWRKMTTGDKVLLITTSALIAGGALTGIASDPDSRRFMLDQLDGKDIGVPKVDGLSVKFNTKADNLGVMFTYDLAPLISRATGW